MLARYTLVATFTAHGLQVRRYAPTFVGWLAGFNLGYWTVTKVGGDWSKHYTVKGKTMEENDEHVAYPQEPLRVVCKTCTMVFEPASFVERNTRGEMRVTTIPQDEHAAPTDECLLLPNGKIEVLRSPVLCG
jgi:hypothetical protein